MNTQQNISVERIEDSQDVGQRYRFKHLALRTVLKDFYFSKDVPGPGDQVPDFDLPTLGGGRFRSTDLGETGPTLLIFGPVSPGLGSLRRSTTTRSPSRR